MHIVELNWLLRINIWIIALKDQATPGEADVDTGKRWFADAVTV
jgi:hypothetical protein